MAYMKLGRVNLAFGYKSIFLMITSNIPFKNLIGNIYTWREHVGGKVTMVLTPIKAIGVVSLICHPSIIQTWQLIPLNN